YPELPNFFDLKALKLQAFASGAKIYNGRFLQVLANPLRHPKHLFTTLTSPIANTRDKALLFKLISRLLGSEQVILPITTLEYLRTFGFSQKFVDQFWRPFFTGIFLDPTLSVDPNFFLFLLRCFAFGRATLPARGMATLAEQLVSQLNTESISLSATETEADPEMIRIQAFADKNALVRKASTYYFSTSEKIDWGKWLILIPPSLKMNLNQIALLSEVSSAYAPRGQTLISATSVQPSALVSEAVIRGEIERIAGRALVLHHLKTDYIEHALPLFSPAAPGFLKNGNQYECGDHLSSPSTNGALKSGRMAAEDILKHYSF
ncbi:MAG: hypothetical protein H7333_10080, partial [Bdellovibrionales bacterium]|nr:hypothetical protein [Oligoflexia bacterium]